MSGDIQPISIPIIFLVRKLATVNPNLQAIKFDVGNTKIFGKFFDNHILTVSHKVEA